MATVDRAGNGNRTTIESLGDKNGTRKVEIQRSGGRWLNAGRGVGGRVFFFRRGLHPWFTSVRSTKEVATLLKRPQSSPLGSGGWKRALAAEQHATRA